MTYLVRRVAAATPADADDVDANQTVSKVARRLVPFLVACFFAAYLDRVNVGFAALSMNADLGSSEIFGLQRGANTRARRSEAVYSRLASANTTSAAEETRFPCH
jgi:hypothetical protein